MTSSRTATFLLRQPRQAQGFREPLTDGLALTMLWIPPGSFWMGSPEGEEGRSGDEGPLHLVRPRGYFMGQTPITQAQWREVAERAEGESVLFSDRRREGWWRRTSSEGGSLNG
jgi:formylglycine-generating enzyme required for sulfatase activity